MTREEWYKHQTMDKIESVSDYVQIMLDDAMETDMLRDEIEKLYTLLITLQYDISKQLNKLEKENM